MPSATEPSDFRGRLQAALARDEPRHRLDGLAALARAGTNFIETIQLDRALSRCGEGPVEGYALLRLALLSDHTVEHLAPALRVAGLARGWRLQIHTGAFGQYRQDIFDRDSSLHRFAPELVVLSLSAREVLAGMPLAASAEDVDRAVGRVVDELGTLWRRMRERPGTAVIQQTFLDLGEPLFGSYDRLVPAAPGSLVAHLNDRLAAAAKREQVLLLDIARACARDGRDAWHDVGRWLQGKMEIAPAAAPRFGELVARLVDAQRGRSRKCLVLDLDNTLWGGVVGDAGIAGLVLGEGSAQGEAHLALQRYAKRLGERGVILAVCSKNEPAIAEAAFRDHPEMALRPEDVAVFVANWDDKADNLQLIAQRLNIGLDSLVFVDDNPAERARVREALPMVAVPELPADPALYVRCIAAGGHFEAVAFTEEDRRRAQQYAGNAQREALRDGAQNVDDFLRGLEMVVQHGRIGPVDEARATQLLNKTNQFNTTTRRYSADEIARFAAAPQNLALQFRLQDRFGDNGLVSVMLLRPAEEGAEAFEIENWVMSCRVFGRRLEHEAMNIAVEAAHARGARYLRADHLPTERNGVIRALYPSLGFTPVAGATDGSGPSRWSLDIAAYRPWPTFIARKNAPRD